jgi:hypothetical protein
VHDPIPRQYVVLTPDGESVQVLDMHLRAEMASRLDLPAIASTLTEREYRQVVHRGVVFGCYRVGAFAEHLISLRNAGIFHYH